MVCVHTGPAKTCIEYKYYCLKTVQYPKIHKRYSIAIGLPSLVILSHITVYIGKQLSKLCFSWFSVHTDKWISYRCYFGICTLLIVGIVLLISLSSTLYVISTKPGSLQRNLIVNNDDTVLIDFFNIYSYKGIEIRQAKDSRCSDCKLEVYSFYPDNIIVDDHYFNISATNLTTTHDDVLLAPSYFVSGSKIRLSVKFLPLKAQNTTIEFLLFNNLSQYNTFQAGSRPIALQVYTMSVNEKNKREHSLEITIENTGYYFLGIRPTDSPVTFQFSVAVYQIFYSRNYFPAPICRLESTESCYIPFTVSFSDYYTDTLKKCVFVYSIPPPQVADSYYNTLEYEVYRSFWNSYSIALISLISLSALCVFTTCCYFLCFCLCTATRRRRRHKSVF